MLTNFRNIKNVFCTVSLVIVISACSEGNSSAAPENLSGAIDGPSVTPALDAPIDEQSVGDSNIDSNSSNLSDTLSSPAVTEESDPGLSPSVPVSQTEGPTTNNLPDQISDESFDGAPFSLAITEAVYSLQEGNAAGVNVPVAVTFNNDNPSLVTLSVSGVGRDDAEGITFRFSNDSLTPEANASELNLQLAINVLPILSGQRSFTITASDGIDSAQATITVAVSPVTRDDVYLLIGQSNMVGSSEFGAKQAEAGGADEPNPRIRQANVERNVTDFYPFASDFTNVDVNFDSPKFVVAEDPLHYPLEFGTVPKWGTRIGMGLSLAKNALPSTSQNIILVPAAWPATGFCNASSSAAQWNAVTPAEPELGNTLLFDRALVRINETLTESGGILRGIIWHQGEADSTGPCAQFYEQNLIRMVAEFRSRIAEDARGSGARGPSANIPFVLGTMSRGRDDRGDFSDFNQAKTTVDAVHRNIANIVPFSEVVLADDLVPANGYACGEGSCIHFGALALREMGARSYTAIVRAAGR